MKDKIYVDKTRDSDSILPSCGALLEVIRRDQIVSLTILLIKSRDLTKRLSINAAWKYIK